jgi:hypothetical protein
MPAASRQRLWRAVSVAPLPVLLVLFALWRDLLRLSPTGLRLEWDEGRFAEWLAMSVGTVLMAGAFWAPLRPVRVLGYALFSLVLAFGFGAAFVIAVVHTFGGPSGDLRAPTWALVALGATVLLCVVSLLADAALIVDDVRAGEAEED